MKTKIVLIVLLSVLSATAAFAGTVTLSTILPNKLRVNQGAVGKDFNNPVSPQYKSDASLLANGLSVEGEIDFGWQSLYGRGGVIYTVPNANGGVTTYLTNSKNGGDTNDVIYVGPGSTGLTNVYPFDQYYGSIWLGAWHTYIAGTDVDIGSFYLKDPTHPELGNNFGEITMYVLPSYYVSGKSYSPYESIHGKIMLRSNNQTAREDAGTNLDDTIDLVAGHINCISNNSGSGLGVNMAVWAMYPLDVNGLIRCIGNVITTSDMRWKKNIETLSNPIDKISRLRGVSFEWRRDEFKDKNFPEGKQIGVIGQEVEKEFPELVSTDKEGYKNVAYERFVPILLEAVKVQQKEITSQKDRIEKLENELKRLQK